MNKIFQNEAVFQPENHKIYEMSKEEFEKMSNEIISFFNQNQKIIDNFAEEFGIALRFFEYSMRNCNINEQIIAAQKIINLEQISSNNSFLKIFYEQWFFDSKMLDFITAPSTSAKLASYLSKSFKIILPLEDLKNFFQNVLNAHNQVQEDLFSIVEYNVKQMKFDDIKSFMSFIKQIKKKSDKAQKVFILIIRRCFYFNENDYVTDLMIYFINYAIDVNSTSFIDALSTVDVQIFYQKSYYILNRRCKETQECIDYLFNSILSQTVKSDIYKGFVIQFLELGYYITESRVQKLLTILNDINMPISYDILFLILPIISYSKSLIDNLVEINKVHNYTRISAKGTNFTTAMKLFFKNFNFESAIPEFVDLIYSLTISHGICEKWLQMQNSSQNGSRSRFFKCFKAYPMWVGPFLKLYFFAKNETASQHAKSKLIQIIMSFQKPDSTSRLLQHFNKFLLEFPGIRTKLYSLIASLLKEIYTIYEPEDFNITTHKSVLFKETFTLIYIGENDSLFSLNKMDTILDLKDKIGLRFNYNPSSIELITDEDNVPKDSELVSEYPELTVISSTPGYNQTFLSSFIPSLCKDKIYQECLPFLHENSIDALHMLNLLPTLSISNDPFNIIKTTNSPVEMEYYLRYILNNKEKYQNQIFEEFATLLKKDDITKQQLKIIYSAMSLSEIPKKPDDELFELILAHSSKYNDMKVVQRTIELMTCLEAKYHVMASYILLHIDKFFSFIESQKQEHFSNLPFFFEKFTDKKPILFSNFSKKIQSYLSRPDILSTIGQILIALYEKKNDATDQLVTLLVEQDFAPSVYEALSPFLQKLVESQPEYSKSLSFKVCDILKAAFLSKNPSSTLKLVITLCEKQSESIERISETLQNAVTSVELPFINNQQQREFQKVYARSGFINMGATCYINSTFQSLLTNRIFTKQLFSYNTDVEWIKSLQLVFALSELSGIHDISTLPFCDTYLFNGEKIQPKIQQDAAEFLQSLFASLPKELITMFTGKFTHYIKTTTKTNDNSDERKTEEQFQLLSVPVCKTLSESLLAVASDETLESTDDKNTIRYTRITETPDFLIIHLNRFDYNPATGQRTKLNDPVEYQDEIDLKPLTGESIKYQLISCISHTGTVDAGHFMMSMKKNSYKNACGTYKKSNDFSEWIEYNDTFVNMNANSPPPMLVYILFYKKNGIVNEASLHENESISITDHKDFSLNDLPECIRNNVIDEINKVYREQCLKSPEMTKLILLSKPAIQIPYLVQIYSRFAKKKEMQAFKDDLINSIFDKDILSEASDALIQCRTAITNDFLYMPRVSVLASIIEEIVQFSCSHDLYKLLNSLVFMCFKNYVIIAKSVNCLSQIMEAYITSINEIVDEIKEWPAYVIEYLEKTLTPDAYGAVTYSYLGPTIHILTLFSPIQDKNLLTRWINLYPLLSNHNKNISYIAEVNQNNSIQD